jgi:hypothetical protein
LVTQVNGLLRGLAEFIIAALILMSLLALLYAAQTML